MKKRILQIAVALCMVLTLLPTTAFAEDAGKITPYIDADTLVVEVIAYGQTLADSYVRGRVYSDSTKQTRVEGRFVWENETIKPTAKDDSNTTRYTVIFKPTDSDNYNEVETEVTILVPKAQNAPNMPGSTLSVLNSITKVGDATLPEYWVWQESDKDTPLEVEVAQFATALYEGADQGNYVKESVEIMITRVACDHVPGEILYTGRGEHAPDCVNDGLGHKECTKCHAVTGSGIVVAALGHRGGMATCKKKAVCDYCGEPYGKVDNSNHAGGTEVRNAKDATCTEDGYTGDTYCKGCETKLSSGKPVDKTGHDYESKVIKEATTTSTGTRTYTCENCGHSYEEEIAKLQGTVLPTWYGWELIDKIVAANKKKDEPVAVEPEVTEPTETEPVEEVEPMWNNPFSDVTESDTFYEAIKFAYENGYMNGMSNDTFAPNEGLTRAMLVTVLYRAAGMPVMDEANPFVDVAEDAWYHNAVVWAKSIGLVNGITETEFAPESLLTREQLVTIFYRYATFLGLDVSVGEETNILSYEDFADIAEYAIPAMQWACGMNLIEGAEGNILPKDNATRALVAMVLFGFYA